MVLQKGKIMVGPIYDDYVAESSETVLLQGDDREKEKKHTLISRILGFVAMGLSLIGMLTLFAPLFEVTILKEVQINLLNIFQIKDLLDYFSLDSKAINWLIALIFAGLGLAFVSAILDIFANKPCKIVSTILKGLAFAVPVTFIIFLYAERTEVSAGSGLWANAVLLLIAFALALTAAIMLPKKRNENPVMDAPPAAGGIAFSSGSCAGYEIPVTAGEMVVIGKDPAQCSVIIDRSYKKVSRVHCTVEYDAAQDLYIVTDRSTNGTNVVGGMRLQSGSASYLQRGAVLNLAGTDNIFRLL